MKMRIPVNRPVLPVICSRRPLFTREDCLALRMSLNLSAERQVDVGMEREEDVPAERQVGQVTDDVPAERQVGVGVGVEVGVKYDKSVSDYVKKYSRKKG